MPRAKGFAILSIMLFGLYKPAMNAHGKTYHDTHETRSLIQLSDAIYFSSYNDHNTAMRAWNEHKSNIPILYLFKPLIIGDDLTGTVSLLAVIEKNDIPANVRHKILQDTCATIINTGLKCSAKKIGKAPIEKVQEFQDEADFNTNNHEISNAAMRAAYDLVKARYETAIYEGHEDDLDQGALTQDAVNAAAQAAFDGFIQKQGISNLHDDEEYETMRGFFLQSFKKAAAKSMQSVGKSFVRDITSGGNFKSLAVRSELLKSVDENIASAFIDTGLSAARNSQYAFLRNLEVSYKLRDGIKPELSLLTVQPIKSWQDNKHNLFAQAAFSKEGRRTNYSAGLAYRYLPPSEKYVVGANIFMDYQRPYGHRRASFGLDYQTSLWGASTNYYQGLTGWRDARTGYEERSLDGYDIELIGRLPFLPAVQIAGKSYRWQSFNQEDIVGQELQVEYSPIPALTIEASVNDENSRDTALGVGVRYNYIFGAPHDYMYDWNEQFRQKSASEYIFRKVRRENKIRVEERIDTDFAIEGVTTSPVDGATGVSVGTDITLTFPETIQAGSGSITITDTTDGSGNITIPVTDPRVVISGNIVTIDLSAQILEFLTDYQVTYPFGTFQSSAGQPSAALEAGELDFQTIVDPTAGFPVATNSVAPGGTVNNFEPATDVGTWRTIIDVTASPDGVIFESGATGQGIAASFTGANLLFGAGDGSSTTTNGDTIFGSYPISSISEGRHHFVFVADPDAPAEIGVYIDGIRVINESIPGSMQAGEWAGTNNAGYGVVNSSIRAGVDTSSINGATLISNLDFFASTAPAGF